MSDFAPDPAPLRVWVARNFGTTFHCVRRLRDNPDGQALHLLTSHVRSDSPMLSSGDEAFLEPTLIGDEWVDWALGICATKHIRILWPTHHLAAIAARLVDFAALGTQVLIPTLESIEASDSKSKTYRAAMELGLTVPPWMTVDTPEAARSALAELSRESPEGVCVKLDIDQGGLSVLRLVEDSTELPNRLAMPASHWFTYLDHHMDDPWIVMPWLPGAEHSVDVLRSRNSQQRAAVVRTKTEGDRRQVAHHDAAMVADSYALLDALDLSPLANVQWRELEGGTPVLLEVNPRASGGLYRSQAAIDIDLVWAAIRDLRCGDAGLGPAPVGLAADQQIVSTTLDSSLSSPLLYANDLDRETM